MYTEMMLYKKMYGKEKMMERVKMHEQIYESGKVFSANESLYKLSNASPHISYSKGAIVMVKLSEMLGEEKVNEALQNFLAKYKYPERAIATDFIDEVLKLSDAKQHKEATRLFCEE